MKFNNNIIYQNYVYKYNIIHTSQIMLCIDLIINQYFKFIIVLLELRIFIYHFIIFYFTNL